MKKVDVKPEIKMLDPARARVTWILDGKSVGEQLLECEREMAVSKKVNGFRSGKVPHQVLWKKYRQEIQKNFIEAVVPSLWEGLFSGGPATYPFLPVDRPRFGRLDPQYGRNLLITAEVDVLPRLGLTRADYLGKAILAPALRDINEIEVNAAIEERRHYRVIFKQAPEGQPAASGDYLMIRWRERTAGTEDWQQPLQLGLYLHDTNGNRIPGFDDHLIGAKMGDTLSFSLAILDGRGLDIEIMGIDDHKLRILPTPDEVAILEGCVDLQALQEKYRTALEAEAREHHATAMRQAVMAKIVGYGLPVPLRLIDEKCRSVEHIAGLRALKNGVRFDDSAEHKAELRRVAIRLVQEEIALDEIVRLEAIEASEENIGAEIDRMAAEQGVNPEEIRAWIQRTDSLGLLRRDLAQRKALELIINEAVITEEVMI